MLHLAPILRKSHGLWLIDNIAALMALVAGYSDHTSLDLMAQFVQIAMFAVKACLYFEYVQTKANWSDEISRKGLMGHGASDEGFQLGICGLVSQLLQLPCPALARVFPFL